MFKDFYSLSLSPANFALRGFIVFVMVLVLLRVAGKRQLAQMSTTEFVAILLISNAVQNSMNGGDNSVLAGLILASTLIFTSWLISTLTYYNRHARALFEGTPTLLIHNGKMLAKNLRKERLTSTEVLELIRKQGIDHVCDVQSGVLEGNGNMVIIRHNENKPEIIE
jgi:uncharacterized membrane protein YcaP (DUF421 family)